MNRDSHLHKGSATQSARVAFNALAGDYDSIFETYRTKKLRNRIYRLIETYVSPPSQILDMNCGTGTDAAYFAGRGFHVTGLDISEVMVTKAKSKLESLHAASYQFLQGSYENLDMFENSQFGLVLSNFGGLNCTDNLEPLGNQLQRIVKPGGVFAAIVMPRFSLWETCSCLLDGDTTKAFRRFGRSSTASLCSVSFPVYYHTTRKLQQSLGPAFLRRHYSGLNVLSPPPTGIPTAQTHRHLFEILDRCDALASQLPVLRSMGDHYVALFQKHF
jgi:ubiquinone/menaquinone biosynthesis C-methylase UbiE